MWEKLPTELFFDLSRGCASECAAVINHAGRELSKSERGGGDAGLDGEEDVFLILRALGHVIWLEDYLEELVILLLGLISGVE
jgi:hypothetical protein